MKLALGLATLALLSVQAEAKEIQCNFTEPFLSFVVNDGATQVQVSSPEGERTEKVLSVTEENGSTRVVFGQGEEENEVLSYLKDGQGTDGMSDKRYPYSAQYWVGDTTPLHGGCATEDEPAKDEGEEPATI